MRQPIFAHMPARIDWSPFFQHIPLLRIAPPISNTDLRVLISYVKHCTKGDRFVKSKLVKPQPPLGDQEFADQVIAACEDRSGALLSILEKVQEHNPHKYLPLEILEYIAEKTDIPLAQVFSVATFFALFNLEPQGDHTICICRGTACHTRGSRSLLERLKLELGFQDGGEEGGADKVCVTTPDRKFSLRTVACFGQCALAPVVEVDHAIYGHMNEQALHREVEALERDNGK